MNSKQSSSRCLLFLSLKPAATTSRSIHEKTSQNDTVPTNLNDIVKVTSASLPPAGSPVATHYSQQPLTAGSIRNTQNATFELNETTSLHFYDWFPKPAAAPISEFFKMLRKRWADVCIEVVQFSAFGRLQPVGTHNFCRALVIIGTVRDLEVDPTEFCGVFWRGPDVQLISSDSSSIHADPDSLSTNSTSTSVADIPQLEQSPAASTQILMPTTAIPATDFTESFAQLRASVTQLSIKKLRTRDSIGDLKNQLLSKIDNLEKSLVEAHTQQDQVLRDLAAFRKELQDQKAAMLAFREESQEYYSTLREHLAEIIAYINRGRDDKKRESGSIRGLQPPLDDNSRPSGGGGSRSEP
ncbi:mercuric reductase [Dorcoceras hygrometricum]|uniref:Mercuric reductase n=1 Tax=Dorcoceras hygrometricum TaxID=472368 RepID=A0A2Z7AQY4_9LAMI|nr:mercuric reductase [Dorcoceras hygrometricum]